MNDYEPSPSERVRDQVARYEATDGAEGGTLDGKPVVILTTTGARSGKTRERGPGDPDVAGKNRLYLDLISADFVADTERLLGLGASRVRDVEDGGHIRWTTLQDPQGNEFDLIAS